MCGSHMVGAAGGDGPVHREGLLYPLTVLNDVVRYSHDAPQYGVCIWIIYEDV